MAAKPSFPTAYLDLILLCALRIAGASDDSFEAYVRIARETGRRVNAFFANRESGRLNAKFERLRPARSPQSAAYFVIFFSHWDRCKTNAVALSDNQTGLSRQNSPRTKDDCVSLLAREIVFSSELARCPGPFTTASLCVR